MKCSFNRNALEAVSRPNIVNHTIHCIHYSLHFIIFIDIVIYFRELTFVSFSSIKRPSDTLKRYWPKSLLFIRIECAVISWCTIVAYFNSFCCGISHYYWYTEKQYWTTKYTELLYVRKLLKREKNRPNLEEYCEFLPYVKVLRRKFQPKWQINLNWMDPLFGNNMSGMQQKKALYVL